MGDVEAARSHVCGDQDGARLGLELVEGSQPFVLRHLSISESLRVPLQVHEKIMNEFPASSLRM